MEIREPEFKCGDKVRNLEDGHVYTVESVNDYKFMQDEYWYNLAEHLCVMPESALELYIDKSKTVWDLKKGDECYFIASDGDVLSGKWDNWNDQIENRKVGNAFLTKEEAEFEVERRKVETEMLRLGGRRNINISNYNYYIIYDNKTRNLDYFNRSWINSQGSIFFDTYVDVDKAVKAIGEDRIKKYIFEVDE